MRRCVVVVCLLLAAGALLAVARGQATAEVEKGARPAAGPGEKALGDLGRFARWARVELSLHGPQSRGTGNPNPFGILVDGIFTSPGRKQVTVPGFYDGDGRGGLDGDVWKVRFAADEPGEWRFRSRSENPLLDGTTATFTVTPTPADAAGFYRWGRLGHTGTSRYLKFRDGPYWLKAGCDDPENFLGRLGPYDTLAKRKSAVDYLAARGINSFYIMTNTLDGDGRDVWPWLGATPAEARSNSGPDARFDLRKLDEWLQLFEHMQAAGVVTYLVLDDDSCWTRYDRPRYYREMVARFGHLPALLWNIAEEFNERYTLAQALGHAALLRRLDPYAHPIGIHNVNTEETRWVGTAGMNAYVDDPHVEFTAIQTSDPEAAKPDSLVPLQHNKIAIDWGRRCRERGKRPLMVGFDEGRPEEDRRAWWSAYLGGGVWEAHTREPYDRPMAAWDRVWVELGGARAFMESLPFWEMEPDNALVKSGTAFCLAKPGQAYALYLPSGGSVEVDLAPGATYDAAWWSPSNGKDGRCQAAGRVPGGQQRFTAPGDGDWALRVTRTERP